MAVMVMAAMVMAAIVMTASVITTTAARADRPTGFESGDSVPTKRDIASHGSTFANDEGYFERWMIMLHRSDGGWMQLSFVITNIGPGSNNAVVDLMRRAPALSAPNDEKNPAPAREFYRWPRKVERDDWRASSRSVEITTSLGTLVARGTGYRATVSIWDYELELDITARGPSWKPGSGRVGIGGGHFSVQLAPTLARFKAKERTHRGAWRPFDGVAWVEHGVTNVMPQRLSRRFLRFHGRKGNQSVALMLIQPPAPAGSASRAADNVGWMVVTRGKSVVAEVLVPTLTVVKTRRDPRSPHHGVPTTYKVTGKSGGKPIELRIKTGSLVHREDVLGTLPGWLRGVVQMIVQPVNYTHDARFEVRVGTDSWRGRGVSLYSPMTAPGR